MIGHIGILTNPLFLKLIREGYSLNIKSMGIIDSVLEQNMKEYLKTIDHNILLNFLIEAANIKVDKTMYGKEIREKWIKVIDETKIE